jgi:hypothetical protein
MQDINTLTGLFGWCSVINIAIFCIATLMLTLMRDFISGIHSKMTGLGQSELSVVYFQYLANYKIAILMLNLVPYIALKLLN